MAIVIHCREECLRIENIQRHEVVTGIDILNPLWHLCMVFEARKNGLFRATTLCLPLCSFENAMTGETLTFTEKCTKNFAAQSFLCRLSSRLERHLRAELIKVAYDTALECIAFMKWIQTVCNQSLDKRRKKPKTVALKSFAIAM